MSDINEGISVEKAIFTEDAKIIIDIESIAEKYWASSNNLRIWSTDKDYIDFSFNYGMLSFTTWEHRVIEKSLKKMGYEYTGFIITSMKNNRLHLHIRMRVVSKKRKAKDGLKWIYRGPIRLYYRYRYWRNYGTWRYW